MKKQNTKPIYVKCTRCDLNYIDSKENYCDVCKTELKLLDPGFLLPDDVFDEEERICPSCNLNFCEEGNDLCLMCAKEKEDDAKAPDWVEKDPEDEDLSDEPLPLPDEDIDVGLVEAEEEEEPIQTAADDFEYVDIDEDFDEDFDDEDDDEDEDFDDGEDGLGDFK